MILFGSGIIPVFPSKTDYGLMILQEQLAYADGEEVFELSEDEKEILVEYNEEFEHAIDVSVMTDEQKEVLETLVVQAVEDMNLPTEADAEDTVQEVLNFFDSESEIYGDLEQLTEEVAEDIDENHSSIFDSISGEEVLAAKRGIVSIKLLATAINVVIAFITGGAISWYIRKYGWSVVVTQVASRVSASYKLRQFAKVAKGLSKSAVAVANPGKTIAQFIDSRDKIRNNGWLEV